MMELAPANTNPFETNRLLLELSNYYRDSPKGRQPSERVKEFATRIISGEAQGALWLKQPDLASGVAVIDLAQGAGLRVPHLYLEKDHQTTKVVSAFIEGLQEFAKEQGGLYAICDEIPGLTHDQQRSVMEPLGFVHVGRLLMSLSTTKGASLPLAPLPYGNLVRVGIERVEDLIELFAEAYEGDRNQLFAPKPSDPKESGRVFLEEFFLNLEVPTVPWASLGIDHQGELVASILAQKEYLAPADSTSLWVYDLMVSPDHQKKGLGTHLLQQLMKDAREHGIEEMFLEVIEGNPVERLYARLGFQRVPTERMRKGMWINSATAKGLGFNL